MIFEFQIAIKRQITKGNSMPNKILVIDDLPDSLDWVARLFAAKGIELDYAKNLESAEIAIKTKAHIFYVIDLDIPYTTFSKSEMLAKGEIFEKYPGLMAAHIARNISIPAKNICLFSSWNNDHALAECRLLEIDYYLKTRPAAFIQAMKRKFNIPELS